jgi:hypothetical protein
MAVMLVLLKREKFIDTIDIHTKFDKDFLDIQKLIVRIKIQTHRRKCELLRLNLFCQSKESRLKFALQIRKDLCQLFKNNYGLAFCKQMNDIFVEWSPWFHARRKKNSMKQASQKLALPCEGRNMSSLTYVHFNIFVSVSMMTRSQQLQGLSAITAHREFVPYFSLSSEHKIVLCVWIHLPIRAAGHGHFQFLLFYDFPCFPSLRNGPITPPHII